MQWLVNFWLRHHLKENKKILLHMMKPSTFYNGLLILKINNKMNNMKTSKKLTTLINKKRRKGKRKRINPRTIIQKGYKIQKLYVSQQNWTKIIKMMWLTTSRKNFQTISLMNSKITIVKKHHQKATKIWSKVQTEVNYKRIIR